MKWITGANSSEEKIEYLRRSGLVRNVGVEGYDDVIEKIGKWFVYYCTITLSAGQHMALASVPQGGAASMRMILALDIQDRVGFSPQAGRSCELLQMFTIYHPPSTIHHPRIDTST
jgi:hypothetical protein